MKSSAPLISIVVPVYNVEKYLKECLDSIINQTYHNLEIILVNDGSTDNSGAICEEYANKDTRVKVINQENLGVARARNSGIAAACGEYIMFIDSDDWVDLDMCELMLGDLIRYGVQSVMCAYVREYPTNSLPRVLHSEHVVFSGREFQRRICGLVDEELARPENLDCYVMMCGKLYPCEKLKGIKVTDLSIIGTAEDALFNLEAYHGIDSVLYINKPLYHYRKALSSSLTGCYKPNLESQWENLYDRMYHIIKSQKLDSSFVAALNNRIALNVLGIGLNCVQDDAGFFEKRRRIKKALKNKRRGEALKQLSLKNMPIYWKAFFFSARHKLAFALSVMLVVIMKTRGKV